MSIDRHSILDWLLPHCEPDTASVMYPKGKCDGPGWVDGEDDVARAIAAYRAGTLSAEQFSSITQDGKKYVIAGGTRMGLVPHRDEMVARFCMDFDDHDGDGGNVHLAEAVDRFLDATSIKFTSKSGKGLHCYYALATPNELFNSDELRLITQFCETVRMEYGELDVLRDLQSDSIYIVDVNPTPHPLTKGINPNEWARAVRQMATRFQEVFLS